MLNIFNIRSKHIVLLLSFWISAFGAFFVKVYSVYPFLIEHFYSRESFIKISEGQRKIFGAYSFNFGDLFFIATGLIFVYFIVRFALLIWYRKYSMVLNIRTFYVIAIIFFTNYILTTLLWGLNFNREPISKTMNLDTVMYYRQADVEEFANTLVNRIIFCEQNLSVADKEIKSFTRLARMCSKKINEKQYV